MKKLIKKILGAKEKQRLEWLNCLSYTTKGWFTIIEYLIIVGVLKIVTNNSVPPAKYTVGLLYLVSYFMWFFYCLNTLTPIIHSRKISYTASRIISAVVGLLLTYALDEVSTSLVM